MNAFQVEEILKQLTVLENHLEKMNRYLESNSNPSTSSGSSSRSTTSSTRSSKADTVHERPKAKIEPGPDSNDERPLPYPKSMAGVALIKQELAESERKYNLSRRGLNPNAKEFQPISLFK